MVRIKMCSIACSKEVEEEKEMNRITGFKFKDRCKFCKKEIVDGIKIFEDKIPVAHYSCFRRFKGVQR